MRLKSDDYGYENGLGAYELRVLNNAIKDYRQISIKIFIYKEYFLFLLRMILKEEFYSFQRNTY